MPLGQAAFLLGLLLLNGLFTWIYIVKSSRFYAVAWLAGSGIICAAGCVLVLFARPIDLASIPLIFLVGPMIVGCGLGRTRLIEHFGDKAEQAKQADLFRLKNPKVFD